MKRLKIVFIIIVACILVSPAVFTNILGNQASKMDNRMLAGFPKISMDSDFTDGIEAYLKDRVGFRNEMITFYQLLCDKMFHKLVHPLFDFGDEGQVYAVLDLVTYQHLNTNGYEQNLTDYLKNIQEICKDLDVGFLFTIAPNKESIYDENFPKGYNIQNRPNRTDLIAMLLSEHDIPYVNIKDYFIQIKDNVQLYNDKYDVAHWNLDGLYYASELLYKELCEKYPWMEDWNRDDYLRTEEKEKYLTSSFFPINEYVPVYSLIEDNVVQDDGIFLIMSPKNWAMHYENPVGQGKLRILMFGDSFLNSSEIFLKTHCSEFTKIHSCNLSDISYYVTAFQPDIVIVEAAERVLQQYPWSDRDIAKRSYTFNVLNQYSIKSCNPNEIEPYETTVIYEIYKTKLGKKFMNITGTYAGSDGDEVQALIAFMNGKQYVAKYNKENKQYIFSLRLNDIQDMPKMEFYKVVVAN